MNDQRTGINYGHVQLALLALVVGYGIALLCGVSVPIQNKEAFAGVWAVILTLLNVDTLRQAIAAAATATLQPWIHGTLERIPEPEIPAAEKQLAAPSPAFARAVEARERQTAPLEEAPELPAAQEAAEPEAAVAEQQAAQAGPGAEEKAEPAAAPARTTGEL